MDPPAGTDPAASSVPRTCSAIELRRHELEEVDSNHHCRAQGLADCRYLTSIGAAAGCYPRLAALTRGARSLDPAATYPGEIRTHTARLLMPVPPVIWATRAQSRHPVPTRATRCTRAGPQPCATAKLPAVDSNHDRRAQNAASYQLDERALVRAARFERALDRI